MKEYIVEYETAQVGNGTAFYGGKIKRELIRCADCDHSSISATSELMTGEIVPFAYICRLHREPTQGNGFCHKAMPKRKGRENQ